MIEVQWSIEHEGLSLGVVEAHDCVVESPCERLDPVMDDVFCSLPPDWPDEDRRKAVREMLRGAGYKPSGRGKPASEYLAAAWQKRAFPRINNLVDVNNLVSLETALPASILDLDLACAGVTALEVRYGTADESYVFNNMGQTIALKGLLGVGRLGGELLANPVKDAMTAKTHPSTTSVLAIVYAPRSLVSPEALKRVTQRYATLLQTFAGARHCEHWVLGPL